MTPTLEQICGEIIEAGEKATKRPWFEEKYPAMKEMIGERDKLSEIVVKVPHNRNETIGDMMQLGEDSNYLVTAANNADKLARACLVMREALEKVKYQTVFTKEAHGHLKIADEALAAVEKIMKEDGV